MDISESIPISTDSEFDAWLREHGNLGQRIDDERWAIRFTPRRPGSNWSDKNRGVVSRLLEEGRMTPAGIAVLPDDIDG
jgi:hypothetical protein